jgi:DnaA family protein
MKQLVLDMGLPHGASFANFCVGSNLAALQHLKAWFAESATSGVAPPTYFWGTSGCGKSHLLQALAAALRDSHINFGWLDANCVKAPEFQTNWRVLLLDDVHAYNTQWQETAFNWFINAQTHRCAIFATGSAPPADLSVRDDLRTRLGWGHVFALQTLNDAERRAVLLQNALARGIVLNDDVLDFILNRFSRDLSTLMALLDLLDDYALQTQRAITIPLIKAMMNNT